MKLFHIHKWVTTEAVYSCHYDRDLGLPVKKAFRRCASCGKTQQREDHCLGVNPPTTVSTWVTT